MASAQILIVEDRKVTARHLQTSLKSLGYVADCTVATGEEAVVKAHELRPDVIILDVMLAGEMDGIEAAEQIRSEMDIPIVFLTAYADDRIVERAKNTEPFGYLLKPFRIEELRIAIEMAIFKHAAGMRLRETERRLELALQGANVGLWDLNFETGELEFDQRSFAIFGYGPGEIETSLGAWGKLFHPDDLYSIRKTFNAHAKGKTSLFESEYRVRHRSGQWRWNLCRGKIVDRDKSGNPLRMTGTNLDITDRKDAELAVQKSHDSLEERVQERTKELAASEEKYRLLVENANEGILVAQDGMMKFINSKVAEILGYSESELISRPFLDFVHPDDRKVVAQRYEERLGGPPQKEGYPFRVVDKEGSTRWVEMNAVLIEWEGRPATLNFGIEVTDRKRIEEDRTRLVTAIEQAAETVMVTDSEGTIEYVNPAFADVTGYSPEEAIGQNPRILSSGEHDEAFYSELWKTINAKRVWRGRLRNRKKNGTLYVAETTISSVTDELGNVRNYVAVTRDITGELALGRQLRQAQKMEAIGTLAGGIAHDFNNILFAISGYAELALINGVDQSRLKRNLHRVLEGTQRAKRLVNQILTFSRHKDIDKKPISLSPIVREASEFLRATVPTTIEIVTRADNHVTEVLADPTQIHQVIMNLATNASDAMRDTKGLLEIILDDIELDSSSIEAFPEMAPGPYTRLTVTDTGHGIDREVLDRIFDPYFTTKDKGRGTGLGLSVVHGIVQAHGGTVKVYSEPGRGTSFHVYFPATSDRSGAGVSIEEPVVRGDERILFVDDEPAIAQMGKEMLESMGYEVEVRTSSRDALELFLSRPDQFDLLVTDMTMPGMTGY